MTKKMTGLIILMFLMIFVGACSSNSSETDSTDSTTTEKDVTLTLGHIFNEDHPGHLTLEEMAAEVENRSNGTIKINISSGGALGTEKDMMGQIQTGSLDMTYIAGISMYEGLDPRLGIEDVPFLFESKDQAYNALDSDYGDKVKEILAEKDINILSYWDAGFRHFTNSVRPIETPNDLGGIKFRSSPIELRLKMFEELGTTAIPIDFNELFVALQQGTVDGQENPLSLTASNKFYEVQDYLSLSSHILNASQVSIGSESLNKLSENQQTILSEVVAEFSEVARDKMEEQEELYLSELKDNGMEVNDVDFPAFQEAMGNVEAIYIEENGDELINLARQ